jgi:hypothetical protein
MNENDSLRSWELDRLTSCELDRVRQDEKLYLTEAIVSYDRWRSSAGAPPLTARRLSAFLAAVPGVKKDEEGHHKVIVFLGVALKPRDRQD